MKRASSAIWWAAPSLICLAFYWYALKAWFQADDFAWLKIALDVHSARDLLPALFEPRAQGTIRPWSERAFFMAFYSLFGLDALPFRIWVFLTQFANLALIASLTRRLTGSRAAGFWAPVFWVANSSLSEVMAWTSAYNQALCGFFLLLAFHFFLRFVETGKSRYYWLQAAVFLLGFGALEINVVYPALAASYAWFCARKYLRHTLALFPISIVYVILHRLAASPPTSGVYAMHFTGAMLRTLATYWAWTIGPTWLESPLGLPAGVLIAAIAVVSLGLLGFALHRALRGDRLPLFLVSWYLIAIAPVLPLRDHLTEYYPFLPAIGLAMLGGWAVTVAWRRERVWKAAAIALSVLYLALTAPEAWVTTKWQWARSRNVKKLVLGVESAHQIHPFKVILLEGVDDALFWSGVLDRPFRLVGANHVYLAPGTEKTVQAHPEWGDVNEYVLPEDVTQHALDRGELVVYDVRAPKLRNITSLYAAAERARPPAALPRRVDVANPLTAYLLGEGWHQLEGNHRWMSRRATVRLGGPRSAGEKLILSNIFPGGHLKLGPLTLTAGVDGTPAGSARIVRDEGGLQFEFPLPASAIGKPAIEVTVEVDRVIRPPGEDRELGIVFGVFEIR